ncbi:uncharacterized protein HaLaN_31901, partial [Haematococcus lacustris]
MDNSLFGYPPAVGKLSKSSLTAYLPFLPYPCSCWSHSQHNAGNSPWIPRVCVLELLTPGRDPCSTLEQHRRLTMKFGKRLASEALRRHTDHYFDYKAIKKAIKDDIDSTDANGTHFQAVLVGELQKVSQYYSSKAELLEVGLAGPAGHRLCSKCQLACRQQWLTLLSPRLIAAHPGVIEEGPFPRARRAAQRCSGAHKVCGFELSSSGEGNQKEESPLEEASTSLHALDLLIGEVFFTSPRLASLATEAEVLSQELAARRKAQTQQGQHAEVASQLLEEYQCPVCLDTLHNPVVLTC